MEFLSSVQYEIVFAAFVSIWLTIIMAIAIIHIDLSELFANKDNKVSHTKFWANIAYFVTTVAFIKLNFTETFQQYLSEIWLIYLSVVAGNASLSKWISLKYEKGAKNDSAPKE